MFDWVNTASEKVIEKLFLDIIKDFTPQDLTWATNDNASLLLLTEKNSPKLLRTASGLAKGFQGQGHLLNSTNLMTWLEEKRKDLWLPVSISPRKRTWMQKQIEDFRRFLFS